MDSIPTTIDLETVSYRYPNGVQPIRDVSLHVGQGEIVSLVGPSGCGKTTVLNLVAGLLQPASGRILVDGKPAVDRLGTFGYMPQKDLLLPWRSAVANAAVLVEVSGMSRRESEARAMAMLSSFDLSDFAASRPSELSGGMRQRVALIRTLLPGHDVLLDEPFGALDAITRADLQEWLMDAQLRTGRSMLMVTHDLEEAVLLSDRVHLMSPRPGTIVFSKVIDLPRPRSAETTTTPAFVAAKSELFTHLRAQIARKDHGLRVVA